LRQSPPENNVIGITSTIPVEVIYAAGLTPVDINNIFIGADEPDLLVTRSESAGFPGNICAWIKGIYSTALEHGIRRIIAVTGGDCSNTLALSEIMDIKGLEVIPFDYPLTCSRAHVEQKIDDFRKALGTSWADIKREKERLDRIRRKLKEIDHLTFVENVVTGYENHLFLVSASDFRSDPDSFEKEIDAFLDEAKGRRALKADIRLGVLGVPPIFSDFYQFIESLGTRVVFNEVQRQFSMPYDTDDIAEQYTLYTYPYGSGPRIRDIEEAIAERKLDGLIHYTQTFCFRQLYDMIFRERLKLPILTIEGDRPGAIDRRTALRIEAFVEMIRGDK
jgi:benzoyl-CoA reductase/2-hydroxyglutaryl-CoA dehydratase subunit BcrC/BadD/HgdB